MYSMDITVELNKIIDRYSLDECYPDYRKTLRARELVLEYAKSCSKKILCVATSAFEVIRFKKDCKEQLDAEYVVVRSSESGSHSFETFLNYDELEKYDYSQYDYVFIISLLGEGFLKRYFRLRDIECESLYDYFLINGLQLSHEYYNFFEDKSYGILITNPIRQQNSAMSFIPFERYRLREEYENSNNKTYRQLCLKMWFFLAIIDRDFVSLKEIFDQIKLNEFEDKRYESAYNDVEILIDKIRSTLADRREEVITAFWIDAISYKEACEWDFITDKKNSGIWFTNMFTSTPSTAQTMRAIMCEKLPLDDQSMKIKNIDENNSTLIASLQERGYELKTIEGDFASVGPKFRTPETYEYYTSFSIEIWEMMRQMCLCDKKQFFILHELMETHDPFMSCQLDDRSLASSIEKKETGKKEVERQISFWDNKMPKNSKRILFSDHGSRSFAENFQIFFLIYGNGIKAKKINSLIPASSFRQIIEMLIDHNDIEGDVLNQQEIIIQDVPYYNGRAIGDHIDSGSLDASTIGYKGIIDSDYMYAYFSDGSEWLCSRKEERETHPNLAFNIIDNFDKFQYYTKRKNEWKVLLSIDEDSGTYSKYLGRAMREKRTLELQNKKREILKKMLSDLPNSNVAIRTGGVHTFQFLFIISGLGMLDKISYIIDTDKNCKCSALGIPVVSPEEAKSLDISALIAGYFDLDDVLKDEYLEYEKRNIPVYNIYDKLEEEGIYYRDKDHAFYYYELLCDTISLDFPRKEVGM